MATEKQSNDNPYESPRAQGLSRKHTNTHGLKTVWVAIMLVVACPIAFGTVCTSSTLGTFAVLGTFPGDGWLNHYHDHAIIVVFGAASVLGLIAAFYVGRYIIRLKR